MQKNTVVIIVLLALIVGFGAGIIGGKFSNRGDDFSSKKEGNSETMSHSMDMGGMDMGDMMHGMSSGINGKTGDAFDKAFLSEMIVHHQGAVEMAKQAITNAKHQEIKDLATAIIVSQNKEIADMKTWQKSWYNL